MSYQLQNQFNVWWQTLANKETFDTYQKTIQLTWRILQETAKLVWLFLCLGLVSFTWLGETSQQSGRQLKDWIASIPEPKADYIWSETRERLTAITRSSATSLVSQAKEQLGLPTEPKAVLSAPSPARSAAPPKESVTASPKVEVGAVTPAVPSEPEE
ncbi:hypothetical protein [Altericista sp. CCNU0014]|uniref:hypothetical protein n=1 Tax=Altericista sp. CCNU0014 TaxID=3082949 RepID=UPI00384CED7E